MAVRIQCVGRRSIEVEKTRDGVALVIYWKDRRIAAPQLEKTEALKLVGELNGLIRFDPSQK